MTGEEQLAAEFETHRPYLHAIAFRVLGSHADADDAAQEAWLRLARVGGGSIENLRGWLTTVTGRICLDVLRKRGTRGEEPLELSVGLLDVRGAQEIARNARAGARAGAQAHPAVVDGLPGLLVTVDGRPVTVLAFTVANGAITSIRSLTDPDRLAQIVPSWVA